MDCGKIKFATRALAVAAMKGANNEKRKSKRVRMSNSYFCNDCDAWHTSTDSSSNNLRTKKFIERHNKAEAVTPRKKTKYEFLNISNPTNFKIR